MKNLILESALEKLQKPTLTARARLLITFNATFGGGIVIFVLMRFFFFQDPPRNPFLFFGVLAPPTVINLLSLYYNYQVFRNKIPNHPRTYQFWAWASLGSYMLMALANIFLVSGRGLDIMLTNFAMAITVMFYCIATFSMRVALGWVALLVCLYLAQLSYKEADFEYHFLTQAEAKVFRQKIDAKDPEALARYEILRKEGTQPVKLTMYIYLFAQYLTFSCFCAYGFNGILKKMTDVLPAVISDIQQTHQALETVTHEARSAHNSLSEAKKRLISTELANLRKRELINDLRTSINRAQIEYQNYRQISQIIDTYSEIDKDLEPDFRAQFEAIEPEFLNKLEANFQLTATELRLCAYLRLNMGNKEIGRLMQVSSETLRNYRHRLAKKLQAQGRDVREVVENL